jgi:hypothetical protein
LFCQNYMDAKLVYQTVGVALRTHNLVTFGKQKKKGPNFVRHTIAIWGKSGRTWHAGKTSKDSMPHVYLFFFEFK